MEKHKAVEFALRAALVSKGLLGAIGSDSPTVWRLTLLQAAKELLELAELIKNEEKDSHHGPSKP